MLKPLTIWIPTFQRHSQLLRLLDSIIETDIMSLADIVISDNDPESDLNRDLPRQSLDSCFQIKYIRNSANLSAGANFLRAFESCRTSWLMIVGDDDTFDCSAALEIAESLRCCDQDVVGIKFDSSLYGKQKLYQAASLSDWVDQLRSADYADAFNNLCLVSNWIFRASPCRRYLSSGYLGYSSKVSHLFPAINAASASRSRLFFSPLKPVIHGCDNSSSWPKGPTWYEMVITLQTFTGFILESDRRALLRLLHHGRILRNAAKCLRIHQYYSTRGEGVRPWIIHAHLILGSWQYLIALISVFPFLFLPFALMPRALRRRLGDPGRPDRW